MSRKATTPIITFDAQYKRMRINKLAVAKIPAGTNIKLGRLLVVLPGNDIEVLLNQATFGTKVTDEKTGGQVLRVANLFDEILVKHNIVADGQKVQYTVTDVTETPGQDEGDFIFTLKPYTA